MAQRYLIINDRNMTNLKWQYDLSLFKVSLTNKESKNDVHNYCQKTLISIIKFTPKSLKGSSINSFRSEKIANW